MISVLSLYDSSPNVSSSDIASSKACENNFKIRSGHKLANQHHTRQNTNLFGEIASAVRRVENLIVEDREVKSKPQSNRMSWR